MKLLRLRVISVILILSLCISLWGPVGGSVVVAEGAASTENSENSTTDEENTIQYEIVLLGANEEVITSLDSLEAGESVQLTPRLRTVATEGTESVYVDGATFTYASSDENVAVVSESGLVTAKELSLEQNVSITITWISEEDESLVVSESFSLTVKAVPASEVQLASNTKTVIVNNTYDLSADVKVLPDAAAQEVIYTSGDESIATVNEAGMITAKATGTTTITVTSKEYTDVKNTIQIEVIDIPVSLELNKTAHSMKATESFQLEVQVVYASGKKVPVDASMLEFQSGNETVVTVDKTGCVTGLVQSSYPQLALVQVSYEFEYVVDGKTEKDIIFTSCQVTVTKIPVEEIRLANTVDSITMQIGDMYELRPVVFPSNATNQNWKVKSSDKAVNAKIVNNTVLLTAKKMAKDPVIITIYSEEDSSVKATFTVHLYQTVFNVAELGVDGTDKSDDADKLNDILWYATCIDEPITVVVPDGTYYIKDTLKVYSETNIVLTDKAEIKRMQSVGGKTMLVNRTDDKTGGYDQCRDIVITGGTWNGNATGADDANCLYFGHAKNITITDTKIINNSGAHLIEFAGVQNALVENVELYGYTKCKAKDYKASQADKEAIQIDYCSAGSAPAMKPYDGTACDTITIRNCNIHDYMSGIGTHTNISGVYSKNIRIENNTFKNISNACVNLRNFKSVNIANNTAKNCTTFLYASGSQGNVINNKVTNGTSYKPKTSSGLRAKNGITISNGSSFTIEKNTFQKAKSNGICIWNGSTATIKNNKLKNNKLYGIRTQGSTVTLKKNSFSKNKKGLYHTYKDAKIKSSDDIRAYYINIKKSYKYKGKAIKPKITIKGLSKKYYKVSYKNYKKPGTATVIIKGKGKVKQTLKIKYKIKA